MFDSTALRSFPAASWCGSRRIVMAVLFLSGVLMSGCRPKDAADEIDVQAAVEFMPDPPAVGGTALVIILTDAAGQPVRLGHLEVEGNMNHAGMKPVFTRLEETEPGRYAGTIRFSMGGDWFLLLSGQFPGEGRLNKKIDVPGVRSK